MTLRDGMGREGQDGYMYTCKSMADSCQCMAKTTPANAGDAGSILGLEDPLEKKMTTHSSILG